MPRSDWNDRYATDDIPWDTGEPLDYLADFVHSRPVSPGRALDIGCGTGTNSIWLAGQDFDVLGIDVSDIAIEKARDKLGDSDLSCRFATLDFLKEPVPDGLFDFVFDVGCFHIFDEAEDRSLFAERVASVLHHEGRWLSLIGSTEGPERDHGPPRRSLREVVNAIEPSLEIIEIRSTDFRAHLPTPAAAWVCVARHRRVPAQPSTRRG